MIAHKGKTDPRLGSVKLNKLLYYADFTAYRNLEKAITGAEYQHLPEGPARDTDCQHRQN
ncbi:MAG: type II toxin-antitoxin system antitoxin SocA domain-containing protein [Nitrospirota bacterium]